MELRRSVALPRSARNSSLRPASVRKQTARTPSCIHDGSGHWGGGGGVNDLTLETSTYLMETTVFPVYSYMHQVRTRQDAWYATRPKTEGHKYTRTYYVPEHTDATAPRAAPCHHPPRTNPQPEPRRSRKAGYRAVADAATGGFARFAIARGGRVMGGDDEGWGMP